MILEKNQDYRNKINLDCDSAKLKPPHFKRAIQSSWFMNESRFLLLTIELLSVELSNAVFTVDL